ncbi:MAG: class I SAM-dependent methyltransferase [Nitrospirae bacterium]|nr:class I SAM-dependent methyltransferase [Nitrospirota bacterium]
MAKESGAVHSHSGEVKAGERFEFGKNWNRFLSVLDEARIKEAEDSLKNMLNAERLEGRSFLDIGSGSGLFSLAARRLGAKVHSVDYDPHSVACAVELRKRYFNGGGDWVIEEGSVLDRDYISSLGKFDIVYSWGVLHHTGDMWMALDNASIPVKDGGTLFVAIYNDEGAKSDMWVRIKKLYCSGMLGRTAVVGAFFPVFALYGLIKDVITLKNPLSRYTEYKKKRGMSVFHDWLDWLGGYPFEVASPAAIFDFYFKRGFTLVKMATTNGLGNNEFVFRK